MYKKIRTLRRDKGWGKRFRALCKEFNEKIQKEVQKDSGTMDGGSKRLKKEVA